MADFSALIQRIKDAVYENGVQAITGQILQDCLKDVVNTVNVAKQDGIYRVTVTVDNNTGVPSATARMDDDTYTLEFSFHNLKGETGPQGPQGDTPVLTADSDGVIYSDGVMLTRVIKDTTDALTTRADSDHARAESDHARAETDHTDITRARGDAETAAGEANYASLRANTAADNADAAREAIQSDLAAKQDVIVDLPQIRAGATDTVKYSTQSLTDAQKGQARANIGAASDSEVSQLRSEKADKDGYYPEMSVGSLKGTEVTQVEGITAIAKSTGIAKINEVMGRSLVWDQLVQNGDFSDGLNHWNQTGVVATVNADDVTIHATSESYTAQNINQALPTISGHKYFLSLVYKSDTSAVMYLADSGGISLQATESFIELKQIRTSTGYDVLRIYPSTGPQYSPSAIFTLKKRIVVHDLTQLFGSGNEPSTVAEFESWLANNIGYRDYYAYNPGEIISNNTEKLEITGLNQWDGEYTEVDQRYLSNTGAVLLSVDYRVSSYIDVLGNTEYYFKNVVQSVASAPAICWYDSEKNFISGVNSGSNIYNKVITSPLNARYLRCSIYKPTADISSVSVSGSRNGEYEPYQKSELELNLATITGKLNGEGDSVVIFPGGLGSVMDAYDRLIVDDDGWCRRAIRTVFSLDLGDLNWTYNKNNQEAFSNNGYASLFASGRNLCAKYTSPESARPASMPDKSIAINASPLLISGNFSGREIIIKDSSYTVPADLKASLTGVKLYYEGYPQEYVLDTPIQMTFQAKHGGVIRQLPENGSAPTTAPMRMSVTYALDAVSILTDLPENYVSKESLQAMLSAMQSAGLFSAYTMTFNESTGKYEFTFTANA